MIPASGSYAPVKLSTLTLFFIFYAFVIYILAVAGTSTRPRSFSKVTLSQTCFCGQSDANN